MGVLHRYRLILALVVGTAICGGLALPGHASAAAELTLLEEGDGAVTRNFGESRSKQVVSLYFSSSEPLTSPPSVAVSDAQDDGKPFEGTLGAAAEVVGQDLVKVNVTVEPGDISEGSYSAQVLLRGGNIEDTSASLLLDFNRHPTEFFAWIFALAALAIGVLLGGLLKWLSTSGTKLRLLSTRYDLLMSSFDHDDWTPPPLKTALSEARVWLALGEVEKAEEKLKSVEEKTEAVLAVMAALAELKARIDNGAARIESMRDLEPEAESRLREVLVAERKWLQSSRDGAYPDPSAGKDLRDERARQIAEFDAFLVEYADPSNRGGKWDEALTKYQEGDFAGAKAKWSGDEAAAAAAAPATEAISSSTPGFSEQAKWFAIRHAPTLVGALIAFGVVVVGLQTVFNRETMFLTNDVRDFLALTAWGFGSALTGLTVTELATKVLPKT